MVKRTIIPRFERGVPGSSPGRGAPLSTAGPFGISPSPLGGGGLGYAGRTTPGPPTPTFPPTSGGLSAMRWMLLVSLLVVAAGRPAAAQDFSPPPPVTLTAEQQRDIAARAAKLEQLVGGTTSALQRKGV